MTEYQDVPLWTTPDEGTVAVVTTVDADWRREADRATIDAAVRRVAMKHSGQVDPNFVRDELTNEHGLTVNPRSLSARYMALVHAGVLRFDGEWGENRDKRGRNAGRPCRIYRYIGEAA